MALWLKIRLWVRLPPSLRTAASTSDSPRKPYPHQPSRLTAAGGLAFGLKTCIQMEDL